MMNKYLMSKIWKIAFLRRLIVLIKDSECIALPILNRIFKKMVR